MTKHEAKMAWRSVDQRVLSWWLRPMAWSLAAYNVFTCFIGLHSMDDIAGKERCVWCGHEQNKQNESKT